MTDPYRYFRIEARELTDELTAGLSSLARGAPTADLVGAVLRHAHTLKGAARVVGQPAIADGAHALEELLGPFRGTGISVPDEQLDRMQALVDEISARLGSLDGGSLPEVPTRPPPVLPVESSVQPAIQLQLPLPILASPQARPPIQSTELVSATASRQPAVGSVDGFPDESTDALPIRTARASLAEIDAVLDGVMQSRVQLGVLLDCVTRVAWIRERDDVDSDLAEAVESVQRALAGCADRLGRELRQVHDVAERLRLVPVESIVPDLQRAARDVAAALGKRVLVEVGGGQLRLDAPVLATAQDALRQIVRNAVAHGIESPAERLAAGKPTAGQVRLDVTQSGGRVLFSCSDDGRGIDLSAVRWELRRNGMPDTETIADEEVLDLLMRGGVSTAPTVSEISGRGIGLDIVRDAVQQLGGQLSIRTNPGAGTTIYLTAPLSLTAQEVLLVDAGELVALPLSAVRETVRVPAGEITRGPLGEALIHRGRATPFLPLAASLGDHGCTSESSPTWSVLLLEGRAGLVAIGVDRLIGTAEIAIRALPELAPVAAVVSGAWIDVDGRPRLLLDPDAVVIEATTTRAITVLVAVPRAPILVIDDSLTTRMMEQGILESAGYQVEVASSAEEGLLMAASRPFSLALVDVEMPGMDGFAFVEQTRARADLRHLPCILVTSRASAQDRQRGLDAGARAHIDKGEFHQGTLLDRISELLVT